MSAVDAHKQETGTVGAPAYGAEKDTTRPHHEHAPAYWCTFICIASAILLGASAKYASEWDGLGDYAIVVSAVALGLGLLMLVWYKLIEGDSSVLRKPLLSLPLLGPLNVELVIATFFAVWYIVGASILTFQGPYLTTGNGYFSAWGGAFAGFGYMAAASGRSMTAIGSSAMRGSGALHALTVPSIVLIISLTKEYCGLLSCASIWNTDRFYQEAVLALTTAIVSLVFIVVLGFLSRCSGDRVEAAKLWTPKLMALILVGLWGTPPAWFSPLAPATPSAPTSVSCPTRNSLLIRLCTPRLPHHPTLSQSTA
jgi:hypothetical protein